MKFNEWLVSNKGVSVSRVRKKGISDIEWNKICAEYELYCRSQKVKTDYELFVKL
ncbi:hypothetical protein [Viridibacillus arvi]|uniref:hypothetical protein n=1 Tax=Viridibacillus arvi TaxID=263475 RepID=UPI0034CDABA9